MKETITSAFFNPLGPTATEVFANPLGSSATAEVIAALARQNSVKRHASFFAASSFDQLSCSSRSVKDLLRSRIIDGETLDAEEDAFFVADLGEIARQQAKFKKLLPRVEPFYAMKCNPDPMVIKTLANLGTGFDCASKGEIQLALDQGVSPTNIIYANPCKQPSHIRYAAAAGVRMMTFDNEDELRKIKSIHPNPQLVLRILTDDSRSVCKLGVKFGAPPSSVSRLLSLARDLDLAVIGISFHVGSGCFDPAAFVDAVHLARKAFDEGAKLGFEFSLLDIGGGFPPSTTSTATSSKITFTDIATSLAPAIDALFPPTVRVIAEPGRYYVGAAFTLAVQIVARRVVPSADEQAGGVMYYVNDGVYGSFNCIMFDHAEPQPLVLVQSNQFVYNNNQPQQQRVLESSIWGPTCDSIDCVGKGFRLPEMHVGDWLVFENMGAYTMCAASQFNGFRKSAVVYTNTEVGGVEE